MTPHSPSFPKKPYRQSLPSVPLDWNGGRRSASVFLGGLNRGFLLLGGLSLVILIAMLDFGTESHLSFSIFYLIPVALCAWWGGFSHGVLLSLAGSLAWHTVDFWEDPGLPPAVRLWNGVVRFGTLTLISSMVSRLHVGIVRERRLARTDPLTGAANGRTFYETVAGESERSRRTLRPLTVAYFDLDNFKQLNDQMGHAAGDAALMTVVQTIQLHLRAADLLARLGGDEFALLMPETGGEGAAALLVRLQELLAREMTRRGWPVTLSVGAVTFLRPSEDVDVMIQRVDALMYSAKRKGKGRLEHTVLKEIDEPSAEDWRGTERRATARLFCNRTARIRREGHEAADEEFVIVRDISPEGIGLHLERQLPGDTLLIVEPLSLGAKILLARVLHSRREEGGWRHGCVLSTRLSSEEIRCWLGDHHGTACREDPLPAK